MFVLLGPEVELFGFRWRAGRAWGWEFGWESKVFQYFFNDWRIFDERNQLEAARTFGAAEYV